MSFKKRMVCMLFLAFVTCGCSDKIQTAPYKKPPCQAQCDKALELGTIYYPIP